MAEGDMSSVPFHPLSRQSSQEGNGSHHPLHAHIPSSKPNELSSKMGIPRGNINTHAPQYDVSKEAEHAAELDPRHLHGKIHAVATQNAMQGNIDINRYDSTVEASGNHMNGMHKAQRGWQNAANCKATMNNIGSFVERLALSSEDIEKLINFETNHELNVIPPLPEATFHGQEGDELFDLELPPLHSPHVGGNPRYRQSRNQGNNQSADHDQRGQNKETSRIYQQQAAKFLANLSDIDAARSLLAALGPPSGLDSNASVGAPSHEANHSKVVEPPSNIDASNHQGFRTAGSNAVHIDQSVSGTADFTHQHQQQPHQHGHFSTSPYAPNVPLYCIDPATGQFLNFPGVGVQDPTSHIGVDGHPAFIPFQEQYQHSTTSWHGANAVVPDHSIMPGSSEYHTAGPYNPGGFSFSLDGNGNIAGFDVHAQMGTQFVPGIGMGFSQHGSHRGSFRQQGSPRKSPSKRRRPPKPAVDADALSKRNAQMEQGFSLDESTGRILRHGPALVASTKENKELPVIKSLFDAFNEHNGFVGDPPPGYDLRTQSSEPGSWQQRIPGNILNNVNPAMIPSGAIHSNDAMENNGRENRAKVNAELHSSISQQSAKEDLTAGQPLLVKDQPDQIDSKAHCHPEPSLKLKETESGSSEKDEDIPGRRHLTPAIGHGFITSLVTRELQSSTPTTSHSLGLSSTTTNLNKKSEQDRRLLGVHRDAWSLSWDAYVNLELSEEEKQAKRLAARSQAGKTQKENESCDHVQEYAVDGEVSKRDAIHLGRFPTQDQAGRAHDIAALKLHGDGAIVNFPKENYAVTLPLLEQHTNEEIVAALRKDSQLAMQRSSKYKGVRRTGSGQYEARTEIEALQAATNANVSPSIRQPLD